MLEIADIAARTQGTTKREAVKRAIVESVRSGKYFSGQRLPGGQMLAKQFGVSPQTVHSVLELLEHEGLVHRRHGSGTYVNGHKETNPATIRVPSLNMIDLQRNYLLGHLTAYSLMYPSPVSVVNVNGQELSPRDYWTIDRDIVSSFSSSNPATFHYLSIIHLPWLVQAGVCEDMTETFNQWDQSGNILPIALDCISVEGRIYGFPGYATPTCLAYHQKSIQRCGIEMETALESLDSFAGVLERIHKTGLFEHSFYNYGFRVPLLYVLRYFYEDLASHFGADGLNVIDKAVGLEVLRFFKKAKWQWNMYVAITDAKTGYESRKKYELSALQGKIPFSLRQVTRKRHYQELGASSTEEIGQAIFGWGKGKKQFSIYNMGCWVLNKYAAPEEKAFFSDFIRHYYVPSRTRELDVRYLEDGAICNSNDVFIRGAERIIEEPSEAAFRKQLFDISEKELRHHVPAFDEFYLAVRRILVDPDASVEKEYEYYVMACQSSNRRTA